jgi:hypothetical protein
MVEKVITKMTPASVLKMIRDGINPLQKSFEELNAYFDNLPEEYRDQALSYSRFLYRLEQNRSITPEERDSFIGIYRLIHQVEVSDGAALGALINSNAEVHFSNLLTAVRSHKFKSLDAKISDDFGGMIELVQNGQKISDQIGRAFVSTAKQFLDSALTMEDADSSYVKDSLEQMRQAANVERDAVALLERADLPANADNLLAAQSLMNTVNPIFKSIRDKQQEYGNTKEITENETIWENLLDSGDDSDLFIAGYDQMTERLQEEARFMSLQQAVTKVDVTELHFMYKQLNIMRSAAVKEEFFIPVYLEGELTQVHLTFASDDEKKGNIDIKTVLDGDEVEAQIRLESGKVSGLLIGNDRLSVTKLSQVADIFNDFLQRKNSGWEIEGLSVTVRGNKGRTASVADPESGMEPVSNKELYGIAKIFLQSLKQFSRNS